MGLSNSYFRFKQFTIDQAGCAMKVTTDACIQGAWTEIAQPNANVLDIGTGTALLSLMLAQRFPYIYIDAIELDAPAAEQARANVATSPWAERVNVIEADVNNYNFEKKYDLIICNPPFFNNSLQGDDARRNNARHTNTLTYKQLLNILGRNINRNGKTSILLPHTEGEIWQRLAIESGWIINKILHIKHTPASAIKRTIFLMSLDDKQIQETEVLVIKDSENAYTTCFSQLLSPYYLAL